MKTFILPGFSLQNKQWAVDSQKHLGQDLPSEVILWKHWETGILTDFNILIESQEIINKIGNDQFNILAKSIGTLVACYVFRQKITLVGKIVFCGIPLLDINENEKRAYDILKNFSSYKIMCIQNQYDNHGHVDVVQKFLSGINPEIKVETKPRDDHDYPYFEEFKEFLK